MYQYDEYDQTIVNERVIEFRDQTSRFLNGELSEEAFRPLRLMNGLYLQTHAPMLRVAIPYGLLSSKQMRMLAHIARRFDKGYGHFSTRQNIQFNWPKLEQVPDILAELATVQMHAIQTSGNCIRNTTCDPLAGVAPDEIEDPRPYCEIIRQWSTLHPEFAYLPRKFKIAFNGSHHDRAATAVHDIGFSIVKNGRGETGFRVLVGGGQGRTPHIGTVIREFLPKSELLTYTDAILRVYNRFGRRDNKYKARIKILVNALGSETFTAMVEWEWQSNQPSELVLDDRVIEDIRRHFSPPDYPHTQALTSANLASSTNQLFARWVERNTTEHRVNGYRPVTISLKFPGNAPGDATADQMDLVADLASRYSFGEIRVTHEQNLLLADVAETDLFDVWRALNSHKLATPNIGLLTDIICCPGLDFCSLANAATIPIAAQINQRFEDIDYLFDVGEVKIKMSGCMNACGHHHVGHIGILGVQKKGQQYYQFTLGGSAENDCTLGERLGPAIEKEHVVEAIANLLNVYIELREDDERFIDTFRRLGITPFKDRVYTPVIEHEDVQRAAN
jgi:sulfite reductase (NADPH) hemoprotein beta-component